MCVDPLCSAVSYQMMIAILFDALISLIEQLKSSNITAHAVSHPSTHAIIQKLTSSLFSTSSLAWTLSVLNVCLDHSLNPALTCFNHTLPGASAVRSLMRAIDSLNCCVGNTDLKFLDSSLFYYMHGSSGNFSQKITVPVLCM